MSKYKTNNIIKKIKKYNYISFDIFDTLIKRNVNTPNDIFNIVKTKYENESDRKIPNYVRERIVAEKNAVVKLSKRNPNINEIYSCMNSYSNDILDRLKEIEIDTEIDYCQVNKHFKGIYDYCVKSNKNIIITSDMYMPKSIIKKILSDAGYNTYKKLYVSCDDNHSKKDGDIYNYILDDLSIKSSEIIHIGDSKKNDFIIAKINKFNALLIPKKVSYTCYKRNDNSVLYNYINNNVNTKESKYYQLGFELLGPLLFNYCNWLNEQIKKNNITDIYFLAREGNLLKKAFDYLNNGKNVNTHYLYVSRRSTRVPRLENITKLDDVFKIINMRRIIDVESFLINVGLIPKDYMLLLDKYHIKLNDNISDISNFNDFFYDILEDIRQNAKEEKKNLMEYLRQEKFFGKVAISDVGWVGTMQNSLSKLLNEFSVENEIYGFYIGLNPEYCKTEQKDRMFDYIFSNTNYEYIDIASFLNLFESFFLAQHGTTLKYKKEKSVVKPVLAQYEYNDSEIEIFKSIQTGALDFVKNYKYEINIDESVIDLFNFGTHPSLSNIRLFKRIKYIETKSNYFLNSHSLFYYIFNPKKFYYDFCNCSWKIGFLKNVFKVNIDYLKLYKILKRGTK